MLLEEPTPSGLIAVREGSDHASVQRALRDHDPDLRLVPQATDGRVAWVVYRYRGGDRPAEIVCSWRDANLDPLPLSHGLVDMVQRLDRNTVGRDRDPDDVNRELLERRDATDDDELDEMARDFAKRAKRHPAFHRGLHLRRGDRLGRL